MIDATQFPQGLLGLMGLRANEQGLLAPTGLSEMVIPTIELFDFYVSGRLEVITGAAVAAAVGAILFTDLVVPPAEFWYVREYFVTSSPGAGAAVAMAPLISTIGGFPVGDYEPVAANEIVRARMDRPRFCPPGSTFGAAIRSQTLAPTVSGGLEFVRLRV